MYNKLVHKETRLALVGLGYVGLPIALEFAKKISVIGFDINEERLTMMRQGIDPCKELDSGAFENADIGHHLGGEIFIPKIPSYHIVDVAKAIAPNLPLLSMNCGRLPFLSLPFLHR